MSTLQSVKLRTLLISSSVTIGAIALLGTVTAFAICIPTVYTVTSSAPPPSGNWTDTSGAVWTPAGGFPGCAPGDTAADLNATPTTLIINSAIPNPIIALTLNCPGCAVDIQSGGSLTLSGPGTISSASTIIVEPGGTLTIANGGSLNVQSGASLSVNGGLADIQAGGSVTLTGASTVTNGGVLNVDGGTLTIPGGSTFTVQSNGTLELTAGSVSGGGNINNHGTIQMAGSGLVTASPVVNNSAPGSVSVTSGTLSLAGGGTGDAPFNIGSGAILDFPSATYTMTPNGVVSGAGTLSVTGGDLSAGGVTSPGGLLLTAGTIRGAGFISVANSLTWSGGTLTGSGGSELAGNGTGTLDGSDGNMILDGRTFNNYGYIHYTASSNSLQLLNGATFNTYGTSEINNDGSITGVAPASFNIFPNGLLWKVGGSGGTSTINPPSTNNSNVFVSTGTLAFAGDIPSSSGGFFAFEPGTLKFSASSSVFNASSFIGGDGSVVFPSGTAQISGTYQLSSFDGSATTDICGATVVIDKTDAATDSFKFTSGTLQINNSAGPGSFTMFTSGTWSGGTMTSADPDALFDVAPGATLTIDAATGSPTDDFLIFANDGTVYYTAAGPNHLIFKNDALADNTGLFDIQTDTQIESAGGVIIGSVKAASTADSRAARTKTHAARVARAAAVAVKHGHPKILGCACPATNEFDNSGTVQKSIGSGTTDFGPAFVNTADMKAISGTTSFLDAYTQTNGDTLLGGGNIKVSSALELDGGFLDGGGTIDGDLENYAEVRPGGSGAIGTINVTGNYANGGLGSGAVDIELASASSYDILAITGTATFDQTLNVTLLGGYEPANAAVFQPITFASRTGDFGVKNLPTWAGSHGTMSSSYMPTALVLTAAVTPDSADLDADSLNGPANVNAGASLAYTITVGNNGPDPATGPITVVDTLPVGATAASGSGSGWACGAVSGGTITCTAPGPLGVTTLPTLTFSMTAPVTGGIVSDSATVSSATSDPSTSNNSKTINTTVVAQSDLSISKTGPTGVVAGQNIAYTIVVTNNGPSQALGVNVADPTPANLTFMSNAGGCTTPYPCNLGAINSGASVSITSTYSTSPSFSGNVTNTATVSATTSDPNNSNDSIGFTTNVGAQADLSVIKTGPGSTNTGQNITYTVVVHNAGPSPATATTVSDPTPVGVAFLSNTGACTTPYPCNVGTLPAGQSATITTTYSVPPSYSGGAINNTATVSSSENDPNSADNTSTATTNVGASADVAITKTGPATVSLGSNITYTITVSDFGPSGATGVQVADPTPAGLTFVSNTGACTTPFPCTIGALATGPPVTITSTFNVPANYAGTSITNTATVSSANDPNAANNSSSVATTVSAQADVGITKTGPPSVTVGSNISYTITVSNTGALAAANTFVNDPTPAGLTFVSNSGACSGPFPCALGNVGAGQSVAITSTFSVPANYAGTTIVNTATVSTSSSESNTSNNSATATTPIALSGTADLTVDKSGPQQAAAGGLADYAVVVFNKGPNTATNVVITDPTPAGLSFISNTGACSTPYPCTIASLAPGQQVSVFSRYRVLAQSGSITNTASVSSSSTDPVPGNNSSSATVTVVQSVVCPLAPSLLAPANGSQVASPVTMSWSNQPGATSYIVAITSNGATQTFTTTTASLTRTLVNGSYSWTVQVIGDPGCPTPTSASSSFSVCNPPGVPVPSVVALSSTGQTYSVQWTPLDGTTSYELQEATDAAFSNPASNTLAGTAMSFTKNVQSTTAFYYRVRAAAGCSQTPGVFSTTAPVIVIPLPSLGSLNPNVPVPSGSTQPVTFPIHVAGLPGVTTSFFATVDKPWLAVTPSSGLMPPEGVTFTISADPSSLSDGTWTGTIIIVFGSGGVSGKTALDVAPKTSIPVSISLTTPVSPNTLSSPSSSAVIIPSVGHLAGLGSEWQSDIRIANITALSKKVQLTFSGGSATSLAVKQTTITIDPGATTALDDIVRNWFGVGALGDSSNGVLTVQPLDAFGKPDTSVTKATVASSRTYNTSAAGTLGQFIPATPLSSFIGSTASGNSILALQQIAQNDNYRTNLGLVEATGKAASALISVFNATGSKIFDLPVSLVAGQQLQLNSFMADKGITLTNGHIEVQATGGEGKITAYASVVDSRSTDPLLVSGVPIGGAGASRFVIPGVASLDTAATWRSDVRIFNSSLTPQTTTLTLFPTGNPTASVSRDVTIQPGEVKALDDIVHATFNLTNSGGALHVTTAVAVPLVVTARTYDDTSGGTLGQFVQAVTPADAVGSGDRSLQLLQMEDSPRYRTNLGIAEVTGKAVTAEVTVVLPDSKVAPKVQIPLAAFEYRQFPIISSLGLGNTYNARITVRVIDGQGKITAYGSVIDQKTQDPTFVPAQ